MFLNNFFLSGFFITGFFAEEAAPVFVDTSIRYIRSTRSGRGF